MASDPVQHVKNYLREAQRRGIPEHNAIALATTGEGEIPNVRIVLLKDIRDGQFVFYTNYTSVKAMEILSGNGAAFVIFWARMQVQIRVRGTVETVESRVSDAYFESRSLLSRYGAIASPQSQVIRTRDDLLDRVEAVAGKYGDKPPRPPHWGGYRILPLAIEIWQAGEGRLHTRNRWSRPDADSPWESVLLAP
ncbi:MAG: pyridoxamine 5'-phosphate oxidase [Rhodobacteraceae bacterium]|nr:pyridoxamine 5'-phosphate oxidase [Paracoccaceae bacterium]